MKKFFIFIIALIVLAVVTYRISQTPFLKKSNSVMATQQEATIYYLDENAENVIDVSVSGEIYNINELINVWSEYNQIQVHFTVNSYEDNKLDMGDDFKAFITSLGSGSEGLYLQSFTQTIKEYYKLDALQLTINGSNIETGHNIYDIEF